jgi:hypothetical protein
VVLAIGHALRAHEALGRPDALSGFLEVVHRLFEDGVFVGHDQSIRVGILRSPDCFVVSPSAASTSARGKRSGQDNRSALCWRRAETFFELRKFR